MSTLKKTFADKLAPENSLTVCKKEGAAGADIYQVKCLPCSKPSKPKLIDAGSKAKILSNAKAQIRMPNHLKNVSDYLENKCKSAKTKETEMKYCETISQRFCEVGNKYPGKYDLMKLKGTAGGLRCTSCNQVIFLTPERGSYMFNMEQTFKIVNNSEKKQSSLQSFFCSQ